jgi:D-alanyl-D-alanine dipeptidase
MYRAAWEMWREKHPDWSDVQLRRVTNRFTAPIGDKRCPPPHSSGGAIDVVLADAATGEIRDHQSPFGPGDTRAFPFAARGLSDAAVETRRLLGEALGSVGFTNYPSEFWHWSYGDQGWAYRGGRAQAIYGPVAPEGYVPDPAETVDAPLEFLLDS